MASVPTMARGERTEVDELGPWFHNLHLPDGRQTEPEHPLGDFPQNQWLNIQDHLPANLKGWTVLDVGCNAGFYSFELARRGARVTAIDREELYLRQANWAAARFGLQREISFQRKQVYDLAHENSSFDLVWFMGVFYHLRYPLLALDILARKVRRMMVFQTMTMPGEEVVEAPSNVELDDRQRLTEPGWPKMAFIEKRVADDPTNWWAPNRACVEALLRSSGLRVISRPANETYVCVPGEIDAEGVKHFNDEQYFAATNSGPDVTVNR